MSAYEDEYRQDALRDETAPIDAEQLEDDLAREQDTRDRMWDRADYEWEQ